MLAGLRLTQATASTVIIELTQTGGISIHRGGSDRTTWPNLGLWCLLLVRFVFMIKLGFVVLSSVGAHPRAQRMAPADDRT